METQKRERRLEEIAGLLKNPEFIGASCNYWEQYKAQARRIGPDKLEWDRQAPDFMSKYLDPFIEKWKAYPPPEELLCSPLRVKRYIATMTGRWGMIPVYPWTTAKEVRHRLKEIQQSIGKEHQDFKAYRQALIAKWLEDSYISTRTGAAPSRSEVATVVWDRNDGLNRPSKEEAIADLSEEREAELIRRHTKKGKTYRQAERLAYKSARGTESRAAAAVRMALHRLPAGLGDTDKVNTDLRRTDKLGLAITKLLRLLPTSESSPCDLEAIRVRAANLGNLLLSPEPPTENAN